MRNPRYGELGVSKETSNNEVFRIWRDRDREPESCRELIDPTNLIDDGPDLYVLSMGSLAFKAMRTLLDRRTVFLMTRRFVHDETLKEVADRLGITTERVRQIEAGAIRRIKSALESDFAKCAK